MLQCMGLQRVGHDLATEQQSVGLGPIQIIQDYLILNLNLITSAKNLFPKKVTYTGSGENMGCPWQGRIAARDRINLSFTQKTAEFRIIFFMTFPKNPRGKKSTTPYPKVVIRALCAIR